MSSPVCSWREGEVFDINKKARECGVEVNALKKAVLEVRAALGEFTKLPYGIKIDTPRPDVKGNRVSGGFWVGAYDTEDLVIQVRPRVERYGDMLNKIRETFGDIYPLFLTAGGLLSTDRTLAILPHAAKVLHEAYLLAWREPRYIMRPDGTMARNVALANAVVHAVRRVIGAINAVESYVEKLKELDWRVREVIHLYLEVVKRGAWAVTGELGEMVMWADGEDFGPYWHLAARRIRGARAEMGGTRAKFVMVPSTKLYELYLYALLASRTKEHRECGPLCLEIDGARLYFNTAPFSRLIKKLSSKAPRPDLVLEKDGRVVVVEAKYRELHLLRLSDATRLAAYIADVANNAKLRAVVAALGIKSRQRYITSRLGNMDVEVCYVEVNPDHDPSNGVERAWQFAVSEDGESTCTS